MDDVEVTEVTVPADAGDRVDAVVSEAGTPDVVGTNAEPASCEDTKTDDACFDCCDAKYPSDTDVWSDVLEACCPDDACTDAAYEQCEIAADEACAKDATCSGLDACEAVCWEKPSSGR